MSFHSTRRTSLLVIGASLIFAPQSHPAHAWAIGSQLDNAGCHEPITAQALRTVPATLDTAPVLTPTRDEAAMIADALFAPPSDFVNDLGYIRPIPGQRRLRESRGARRSWRPEQWDERQEGRAGGCMVFPDERLKLSPLETSRLG